MGNWSEILDEAKKSGSTYDLIRRKYLKKIYGHTGRNVIAYYSGWLQKPHLGNLPMFSIGDADMAGFMATVNKMDCKKGLDLILHTPGGSLAATEALVDYLRSKFGSEIRSFVPQMAMSAGTMLALACKSVVLGKHSSLGPIDPQINGIPAHGIVEEFETAVNETRANPARGPFWGAIVGKYNPTLIGESKKAIAWSEQLVTQWLKTGMLSRDPSADKHARAIVAELGDHAVTKSHSRHYSVDAVSKLGVVVEPLEDDDKLQDLILSYHHAAIQSFSISPAVKIIENHRGVAFVAQVKGTAT
ncbi:MAG: serine protease [Myxococcales bacterium]